MTITNELQLLDDNMDRTGVVYSFTDQHGNRHIIPSQADLIKAEEARREKLFQTLEDGLMIGVIGTSLRARLRSIIRGRYA